MVSEECTQDFAFIWMFVNLKILYVQPLVFNYMLMLLHICIWTLLLASLCSRQNKNASYTGDFGKWSVNVVEDCDKKKPVLCHRSLR